MEVWGFYPADTEARLNRAKVALKCVFYRAQN